MEPPQAEPAQPVVPLPLPRAASQPSDARAESPDVPVLEAKAVQVTAQRESYQAAQSITATKTDTPIMETPFSVQVVTPQVLRDQQAVRLETAVQNVSGVLQVPFNQGSSDGFFIRGFTSNNTYRNGVFMPDALGGGTVKREMANVEQVEVLKGPGSILFGRTEPGGIINTVTKQPLATPYYSLGQQFGSYGFYRTTADATGPLTKDETVLYRFNMSYENAGSFRNFVDQKSLFLAPVVRWNLSPRTQITAEYEYQHFNVVTDPGIPPIGSGPAPVSRRLYVGEPLNGQNKGDRHFAAVGWSHQFDSNWTLRHRLSLESLDYLSNSLFFGAANPGGSLDRFFNDAPTSRSDRYQSSLNLIGKVETGVVRHTLLFGYDFIHLVDKIAGNCCTAAPAFNIFAPVYMTAPPVLDPAGDFRLGYKQYWHGFYAQDQITLPFNLHLLAGVRYDTALSRDTVAQINTGAESRLSPRGGLLWQPMKWLSLYGSYTENFGASNTLFNTKHERLPSQRAKQWEAGVKAEAFDGRLRATVAYFDLTKQNLGVPDPANPLFSRAIGEAETRGIEFDISGEILPGWSVIAAYTYLPFAKVTKDVADDGFGNPVPGTTGKRLFMAAQDFGSVWSTYAVQEGRLRGLRVGAGVQAAGERPGDAGNTYKMAGYVVTNLMASYQWQMGMTRMTAQLNVNNLFDQSYFAGTNSGSFIYPGMPRFFMGSLRMEF